MIGTPHKILFWNDQIKEGEMGMTCGTYGGLQKSLKFSYCDPFGGKT